MDLNLTDILALDVGVGNRKAVQETRAALLEQASSILEKADQEARPLTRAEKERTDGLMGLIRVLDRRVKDVGYRKLQLQ